MIKIHIRSGKLTLMTFDDFIGKPLPRMTQRIKINLRKQDLDVFDYSGPYTPPYLYQKSRFINEEFPYYAEQITLEESLDALNLPDFSGYGPDPDTFDELLEKRRCQVDGFQLVRSKSIPDLDAPCGQYLKYRDLIECGETRALKGIPNLPQQADSYTALLDLAIHVLDPVIDYFGMIQLTYGFASPDLTKHIRGRIAPKLDQHASHELNRLGKPVCDRLGAAVDFYIEDENMIEVGQWIAVNISFDRLYIYGPELPIHISYGPGMTSQITLMAHGKVPDRLVPKTVSIENFLKLMP